jgi:hypothetical protein
VREVAIHFGQHVRNWLSFASQSQPTPGASLIAVDPGPQARAAGLALRVYEMEWTNPLPEQRIERIHFVSRVEKAAPFLIAMTVR